MKKLMVCFVTMLVVSPGAFAQAEALAWHSDYAVALEEARTSGKPLLVAFRCVP